MDPLVATGLDIAWHGFKRWVSVIVWTLVIAGIGWAIYAGIIRPTTKPNPTTHQEAAQIVNYTLEPRSYFGCTNFKIARPDAVRDDKPNIQGQK